MKLKNRIAQGAELPSAFLSAGARERVEWIGQLDVDQPGTADHRLPPCTRQGTRDSTGPEIDVMERLLRDRTLKTDVRNRHPPAGPEHAVDLSVNADLVWAEVDDPI